MRGNDRVETQPFACQDDLEKKQYTEAIPTNKDFRPQVCSFILIFSSFLILLFTDGNALCATDFEQFYCYKLFY